MWAANCLGWAWRPWICISSYTIPSTNSVIFRWESRTCNEMVRIAINYTLCIVVAHFFHIFFDIWSDLCPKCFEMFLGKFRFFAIFGSVAKMFWKMGCFWLCFSAISSFVHGLADDKFRTAGITSGYGIRIYPPGGLKKSRLAFMFSITCFGLDWRSGPKQVIQAIQAK